MIITKMPPYFVSHFKFLRKTIVVNSGRSRHYRVVAVQSGGRPLWRLSYITFWRRGQSQPQLLSSCKRQFWPYFWTVQHILKGLEGHFALPPPVLQSTLWSFGLFFIFSSICPSSFPLSKLVPLSNEPSTSGGGDTDGNGGLSFLPPPSVWLVVVLLPPPCSSSWSSSFLYLLCSASSISLSSTLYFFFFSSIHCFVSLRE